MRRLVPVESSSSGPQEFSWGPLLCSQPMPRNGQGEFTQNQFGKESKFHAS